MWILFLSATRSFVRLAGVKQLIIKKKKIHPKKKRRERGRICRCSFINKNWCSPTKEHLGFHVLKIDMKDTFRHRQLVLVVLIHKCTLSGFHEAIEAQTVEVGQDEGVVCLFLLVTVWSVSEGAFQGLEIHYWTGALKEVCSMYMGFCVCVCVCVCVRKPAAHCIQSGIAKQ